MNITRKNKIRIALAIAAAVVLWSAILGLVEFLARII